ncbi:zinc finger protein 830 [Oratosquilla oratoria]|uniref:zinc finger protein 830 n=1 Tax=Oratosquilla oratoria TaxID=337810 RepID=UPI003F75BDA6
MSSKSNDSVKQLMLAQKKQSHSNKQIDSPYAKYNSRGQLMCIVCGVPVKSAIVWQAHINKRSHLENFVKLKQKQQQLNNLPQQSSQSTSGVKRPLSPSNEDKALVKKSKPKGILKSINQYSSSSEDEEEEDVKPQPLVAIQQTVKEENVSTNGLPLDFFDDDKTRVPKEESMLNDAPPKQKEPPKPNSSETLPEGFFDDPVADAKARNVEYKDKDVEEWMAFMKEVSAAEQQSRVIIEEDKEEAALETQIEQANEQIACLEKIVELDAEKKKTLQVMNSTKPQSDSDESSDEEFAPVIWRTKNSLI